MPKKTIFQGQVAFQAYVDFYMFLGNSYGDYIGTVLLSNISKSVDLVLSFPDQRPFTSYSLSDTLYSRNEGFTHLRPINSNYTRVRIGWANYAGLKLYDNSVLPELNNSDTSYLDQLVSFSIYAETDYSYPTYPTSEYSYWDYMQIILGLMAIFTIISCFLGIRNILVRRRRQREALRTGERLLTPVIRPIPPLHKYCLGIDSQSSSLYPISREEFQLSISSPDDTLTATTVAILMPNQDQSYIEQGVLPQFMFGTHIQVKSLKKGEAGIVNKLRTSDGIKKGEAAIVMIPMRIIKTSHIQEI